MADGTNKIIPGETPQDNAGTPPAGSTPAPEQTAPDPATGEGHPNPQRAASDAAEGAAGGKTPAKTKSPEAPAAPKVSAAIAKAGEALLKSNPALEVVYMTSDGVGFAAKNDAENHARGLKNKAVTPVKR